MSVNDSLLEINQTYHRFSMQSFEAGIGSNRRCFFSRTTHGAALPYAPSAFVQMLQSANVLLASKENERFLLAKEARAYHHHKRSKTTASFFSRKTVAEADHSESSDEEDGEPV